jgi:hypothetical protein
VNGAEGACACAAAPRKSVDMPAIQKRGIVNRKVVKRNVIKRDII